MTNSASLIRQVKSKNRLSNGMICLKVLFDLIPQVFIVHLIGLVLAGQLTINRIVIVSGYMLLCPAVKAVCGCCAVWKAHEAAYNSLSDLRIQIINHLKKLPLGFFQERKIGDLVSIVHHDVEQVEIYLAHGLPEIMSAALLPAVIFFIMLFIEWRLALLMICGLPLMWATKMISAPLWEKNFKIFTDKSKEMQENLIEYVANISVVKAFAKEETKTEKTLRSSRDYIYWVKKSMSGISVPMGLIDLFMESGVVLVMIFGLKLLTAGEIAVRDFILSIIFGSAFTSAIVKTATLQHYGIVFNQAMSGIGSILNVSAPGKSASAGPVYAGDIEIRGVEFAYARDRDILKNIRLTFKKGSRNALVGSSGCGKSTLANLMMGFWEPDRGTIAINGKNIAAFSERQLNSLFASVQQEVFLFNLSIEENIRIGNPTATKDEIIAAAKKARIHELIMSLPKGYETTVGEAGVRFSGGEKQRISIARTILKDAPILILDEATSAIDSENESEIQAAITEMSLDKTVILISHHLNAIESADQIVVMDKGTIVDSGKHNELVTRCELYRNMIQSRKKADRWVIKEERA